jgi:protein-disulfide isomerase
MAKYPITQKAVNDGNLMKLKKVKTTAEEEVDPQPVTNNKSRALMMRMVIVYTAVVYVLTLVTLAAFWTENQRLSNELTTLRKNAVTTPVAPVAAAATAPTATPTAAPTSDPLVPIQRSIPAIRADDIVKGNRQARVQFIEYSDLECPFCKRQNSTLKEIVATYGDRVAFVYRHLPLKIHPQAFLQAQLSQCIVTEKGNTAALAFIDTIFNKTKSVGTSFTEDELYALAVQSGASKESLQQCVASTASKAGIQSDMDEAAALGVRGTPGAFVSNPSGTSVFISGAQPASVIIEALEQALRQ